MLIIFFDYLNIDGSINNIYTLKGQYTLIKQW